MPSIYDLPTELVGSIAQQCDTEDFFNFRQTCRWANDQTSAIFIKTYFATRAVMLQRQSLEVLLQISRHPLFGPAVITLVVSMQHFLDDREIDFLIDTDQMTTSAEESRLLARELRRCRRIEGGNNDETDNESEDQEDDVSRHQPDKEAYHQGFKDQTILQRLGLDAGYLVSIMGCLPNCTSLEIGGDDCAWGGALAERSCGVPLAWSTEADSDHTSTIFIQRAFQLTMGAICLSSIEIQNLSITLRDLKDYMLVLPGLSRTNLQTCLCKVSRLVLDDMYFGGSDTETLHLADFLGLFSSLRDFVLNIVALNDFGVSTSQKISNAIRIPALEKFSLSGGYWTASALNQLLFQHRTTLKVVQLETINVVGENDTWLSILCGIKAIPNIHHIAIRYCMSHGRPLRLEDLPEEIRNEVEFVSRPKNRLGSFV